MGKSGAGKQNLDELAALRLTKHHSMVFLPNDATTLRRLELVKPFVFWGHPSMKMLSDVLHKKAAIRPATAKSDSEKVVLTSNALLEEHLGQHGILCVEDLVHAVFSCEGHAPEGEEEVQNDESAADSQ